MSISSGRFRSAKAATITNDNCGATTAPQAKVRSGGEALWAGLQEDLAEYDRPVIERVISRPVRDAAFAHAVRIAYGATCAMTGLKIINGGGRAEVQAAHIRPVSDLGPDSVRNGVALSATVHWMFDRGLVSIGPPPDYAILFANSQ